MSVLFSFSKREDVDQEQAFCMSAVVVAALSFVALCVVRNPKIKECKETQSQVQREEELQSILVKGGENQKTVVNSINAPYE